MLADAMNKAFGNAERMVALAKAAATPAGLPAVLSGGVGNFDPQTQVHNASQQYEANRGWVASCVSLVANRIAGQRICVARMQSRRIDRDALVTKALADRLPLRWKSVAENLEPLESHPLLDLLNDPNELGVAHSLIVSTVTSLELSGRSLWWIAQWDGRLSVLPIPTTWIEDVDRRRTTWKIRLPGSAQSFPIPGEQVVYHYYPDPANPWGARSPLMAMAAAINSDEYIQVAQNRAFQQGIFPSLLVKIGRFDPGQSGIPAGNMPRPTLTPEQRLQIIQAVRKLAGGVQKAGEPFIIDGFIDEVEKLSLAPNEMDFLNSAKLPKDRILQGFRVSPILLGQVEGANRASAIVADDIFVANKVNPLITLISQTWTEWLAPMFSRDGERLVIWIEPAVAHDAELKHRQWSLAATKNYVTPNEYRRNILHLPDIEGGDELLGDDGPLDVIAAKAMLAAHDPYHSPAKINGQSQNRIVGKAAP